MPRIAIGILTIAFLTSWAQKKFQPTERYLQVSSRAMTLYQSEKFQESAATYDTLFKESKSRGVMIDYILGGMSYAKTGNKDKAFEFLRKGLAGYGIVNVENFQRDPDLKNLVDDKRWPQLIEEIKARNKSIEAKLNKPVMALLDSIHEIDQADRMAMDSVQRKFGVNSKEVSALETKIMKLDSSNILVVKKIIDTYGWLGPDEVGQRGASTIFLVIQHADSLTQVAYLPILRKAVKEKKAEPRSLALLEDRVLIKQGKEQIYGSQVRTDSTGRNSFYPIMDEPNVNKRRASVGLGPLEDYAKIFGIEYKVPAPSGVKRSKK